MSTRVVFILPDLGGGGAERATLDIVAHLDRRTFEPLLFLVKGTGAYLGEVPDGVEVVTALDAITRVRNHLPQVVGAACRAARSADLVVGALEMDATYLAALAGRITGRPAIGWVHTDLTRFRVRGGPVHRLLEAAAYRSLARVVTPSQGTSRTLASLYPNLAGRVRTIPNPVSLARISARGAETEDGLPGRPYVLGVGRLSPEKGFDVMIRMHARCREQGGKHLLVILGEGRHRSELEALARALGVEDSVRMPGFVANPYPWIAAADLFLSTSRCEGFGIALVEALALGAPVLAADCPSGPREILEGGRYGLLVAPEDPDAAAAAALGLLSHPTRRHVLADQGRKRAAEFSPEAVLPRLEALFREVAA